MDEPISYVPKCLVIKAVEPWQGKAAELVVHEKSGQVLPSTEWILPLKDQSDPIIDESFGHFPNLQLCVEGDHSILKDIKSRYTEDSLFSKVLGNIGHHKNFEAEDGLLYTCNHTGESILCIPSVIQKKQRLTEKIIAQAHEVLSHFGPQKMADYI